MAASLDHPSTPEQLLVLYANMDRALLDAASNGQEALAAVTQLAVTMVPGVEQASISEGRHGVFRTAASTGDLATVGDQIQYELASGPCVEAIVDNTVFRVGDIAGDRRWPEFGARAHAETGATSMMSLRLFMEGEDRIAGLNLYATQLDAFDDDAQVIATVLATHSAIALRAVLAEEKAANLTKALTSNRRIGMAMGVLMASHKVTEDDAFTLLRLASQNTNRKLVDIAQDVIDTGTLELPAPTSSPTRRPTPRQP